MSVIIVYEHVLSCAVPIMYYLY